jgi:hypothetical protein
MTSCLIFMFPDGIHYGVKSAGIIIYSRRSKPFSSYHDDLVLDDCGEELVVPTDLVILASGFHVRRPEV